jgi:hypothetical protein
VRARDGWFVLGRLEVGSAAREGCAGSGLGTEERVGISLGYVVTEARVGFSLESGFSLAFVAWPWKAIRASLVAIRSWRCVLGFAEN